MSGRIFLTGASGFIGACLAKKMVERGYAVAVLLRPGKMPWRLAGIMDRLAVINGDLSAPESYSAALAAFRPDILIHLGWSGVAGAERNNPAQNDNVKNSLSLMESAFYAGVRSVIGMGSQAEYGPCASKISESTPTQPTTLYGRAKLETCLQGAKLALKSGADFTWLRLFSVYGPADEPSWLIPYVIHKLLDGERPALTAAEQCWDYLYIDDAAEAVLAIVDTGAKGIFNLGSGRCVVLREVMTRLRDLINPQAALGFGEIAYRPDQVMHLEADITALTAATGWKPRVALEEGLRETVEWFRNSRAAARAV
jgi:nucleoside-diphosphate-sugar epimerase